MSKMKRLVWVNRDPVVLLSYFSTVYWLYAFKGYIAIERSEAVADGYECHDKIYIPSRLC